MEALLRVRTTYRAKPTVTATTEQEAGFCTAGSMNLAGCRPGGQVMLDTGRY
mgnify:CR=1 FL=1